MEKARVKHICPFMNLPDLILSSRNPKGKDYNASFMPFSFLGTHLCLVCHFFFLDNPVQDEVEGQQNIYSFLWSKKI